jgi:branched-chain amino acid transport system permease protein
MQEFLQHLINGFSIGSIYALIALGYTMVFGVLQLINFAHADVFMLGAYIAYYVSKWLHLGDNPSVGSLVLALACSMVRCAIVGFIIERFAYRPLRAAPRINLLITAIGVSLFLEFGGQAVFGSTPQFFPQIYQPEGNISLGELIINPLQIVVLSISLVLMGLLHYLIFHTRTGRAMRAVSFSHDLASLMGIPTNKVISLTFMLGSSLAGAAGVMVGLIYPKIDPLMGVIPGLKCFVAAVLGGIGNIPGAVVGAISLGLAEEFLVGYGAPTMRDALAFGILIIVLLFKPSGLFGTHRVEKV